MHLICGPGYSCRRCTAHDGAKVDSALADGDRAVSSTTNPSEIGLGSPAFFEVLACSPFRGRRILCTSAHAHGICMQVAPQTASLFGDRLVLLAKCICRSDVALPHLVLAEAELRQMAPLLPSGTREVWISHHAQPSASIHGPPVRRWCDLFRLPFGDSIRRLGS